jgi:hypothetical protein
VTILGLPWGITFPAPDPFAPADTHVRDRCAYTAACPSCGIDCTHVSIRTDTKVETRIRHTCGGAA